MRMPSLCARSMTPQRRKPRRARIPASLLPQFQQVPAAPAAGFVFVVAKLQTQPLIHLRPNEKEASSLTGSCSPSSTGEAEKGGWVLQSQLMCSNNQGSCTFFKPPSSVPKAISDKASEKEDARRDVRKSWNPPTVKELIRMSGRTWFQSMGKKPVNMRTGGTNVRIGETLEMRGGSRKIRGGRMQRWGCCMSKQTYSGVC
ncbi:uncharacterized protein LOC128822948 [Malaclemys terrapin pileata]|uniref:uncharacterized protein LOC128822948 n=1 Tax=Malaclemys terrapin pileata TaxID=2991368 RepID=UPI0023A8131B|nr:uncharacterized protein LOC128822948 [Malaclemys terrapin pileata]